MGWGHGMRAMGWVGQEVAHFWQGARRVGQGPQLVGQGAPRVGQGAPNRLGQGFLAFQTNIYNKLQFYKFVKNFIYL
jgi:hypothetical protein